MSGDCFSAIDLYFKFFGIWLDSGTRSRMVVYVLWDGILFFSAFTFATLEAMMIKTNIKDLKLFFKAIGMFASNILALLKFCMMMLNYNKLSSLKNRLRSRNFSYDTYGSFDSEKIMSESARFCGRFVTLTFLSYALVGVSAHLSALWRLKTEQHDTYFQGNSTCYNFLPYVFVIPFDDGSIRSCKTALFIMDFSLGIMSMYIAGYDAIFCCLLKCLDTHLQIVCIATKNIRERVLSKSSLPIHYAIVYDDSFPEFEKEMYVEIRKCNRHLVFLLRINRDIDEVFSFTMLLQCITSTFMMASNFFIVSLISPFDPEFYSLTEYMLAALAQLCMICHFGGRITETSSSYRRCLYECNWYSTSRRFKKCILIMMTRLQIPVMMTAGKFFPLSLTTIISVIKGSFSYAAMFKTVGQREI